MSLFRVLIGYLLVVTLMATTTWGGTPKDEAVVLVQNAVAFYKTNGLEKTIDEVSKPSGQFARGELYVFVYDMSATMLAHPNPKLIGQNLLDVPDAAGNKFRKAIVELAASAGKGWVDYKYQNPKSKMTEDKTTYFEKVDDLVICCGVYK